MQENIPKRKLHVYVPFVLVAVFTLAIIFQGSPTITTYLGENTANLLNKVRGLPTKIIPGETTPSGYALFDITLSIPERYREIIPGKKLTTSVELTNFGGYGVTNASINYIITNFKGDIVFIEHEKKVVDVQTSFLKTIDLPQLDPGDYKLFAELLYSNTSAIATERFKVI